MGKTLDRRSIRIHHIYFAFAFVIRRESIRLPSGDQASAARGGERKLFLSFGLCVSTISRAR
jgi:hypothetical protein